MATNEGHIPLLYRGQTFQTYYKIVGSLDNDNPKRPPLVVIHGGPGFTHDYLLPHTDLFKEHLPLLNIEFFVSELENLLKHFGIQDGYHIVGHSWGGMLAAEFVVRRHPEGLKRLVITNSPASVALRAKSTNELLREFPQSVRDAFANGEAEDGQTWREAVMAFYARHGCRVQPFPTEVLDTFAYLFEENGDRTVLKAGLTKDWTIVDRVDRVDVPTLVINGRYDFVQDYVTEAYVKGIPGAKWVKFEESSHMPFWEEREKYMEVVRSFLIE